MNKDVIKKFKAEFEHGLNGGSLLIEQYETEKDCRNSNAFIHDKGNWFILNFNHYQWDYDYIIVINDEYVELRKALAEGKTIQVLDKYIAKGNNGSYFVKGIADNFNYPVEAYRIKPDEPFKVGSYVIMTPTGGYPTFIHQITGLDTYKNYCMLDNTGTSLVDSLKLWTLEEASDDEWVISIDSPQDALLCTVRHAKMKWENLVFVPFIGQTPAQLGLEK